LHYAITCAKNECTNDAKLDVNNPHKCAINAAHAFPDLQPSLLQQGCNPVSNLHSSLHCASQGLVSNNMHVCFIAQHSVQTIPTHAQPTVWLTYDSGANGHYLSKCDHTIAKLPILCASSKHALPTAAAALPPTSPNSAFGALSISAAQAISFDNFPTSLISASKLLMMAQFQFLSNMLSPSMTITRPSHLPWQTRFYWSPQFTRTFPHPPYSTMWAMAT
ncbi:LOW QUALITY PROTEIN: hypothetical protein ACHAW6_007143, partial [Cyclotella cf. meneghiniana]